MKKAGAKERRNNGQVNKKRNAKKRFPKETAFAGADDETRTRDLILTKDVRYHLCHISKFAHISKAIYIIANGDTKCKTVLFIQKRNWPVRPKGANKCVGKGR